MPVKHPDGHYAGQGSYTTLLPFKRKEVMAITNKMIFG
jgi:hypothetical protein